MDPQFQRCIDFVIDTLEGGGMVVKDSGGITRWGISSKAHPGIDIENLTREEAEDIYEAEYWIPCGCERMDFPMSLTIFACAVNQGVAFAQVVSHESLDYVDALVRCMVRYHDLASQRAEFRQYFRGWIGRLVRIFREGQREGTAP
jgi:hypothetical protein